MASTTRYVDGGRRIPDGRPVGELVGEATSEVSLLFRKEVELAKLEMKEQVAQATHAAKFFGVAGFCGYLAVVLLSFAAAWGLAEVVPVGVAFLIVGAIYGVVAGAGLLMARKRADKFHAVPEETVDTLKEDVRWLKERKSSN